MLYLVTIFVVVMSSIIYMVEFDPAADPPTPGQVRLFETEHGRSQLAVGQFHHDWGCD
jgi:hypothetical protein